MYPFHKKKNKNVRDFCSLFSPFSFPPKPHIMHLQGSISESERGKK